MNTRRLFSSGIASLFLLFVIPSAQATLYSFDIVNPPGNKNAGTILSIASSYDDVTQVFSWSYEISNVPGSAAFSDGFWLVVSDGPNPKGIAGELAILYGDLDNGRLSAYEYNGVNADNSWSDPGNFLDSFSLNPAVATGPNSQRVSFSINVAGINGALLGPEWSGIEFANQIGLWFHPTFGTAFGYGPDGQITSYSWDKQSYSDLSRLETTTEVPEPASLMLLGSGVLGLLGGRRKKSVECAQSA